MCACLRFHALDHFTVPLLLTKSLLDITLGTRIALGCCNHNIHIDGLVQVGSNSSALAIELLQSHSQNEPCTLYAYLLATQLNSNIIILRWQSFFIFISGPILSTRINFNPSMDK